MSVEASREQSRTSSFETTTDNRSGCLTSQYGRPRIGLYSSQGASDQQLIERQRACLDIAGLVHPSQTIFFDRTHVGETLIRFLSHECLGKKGVQERLEAIDTDDIETVILWMWILGSTEEAGRNIFVYPKNGLIYRRPIYGLQIIDSSHLLPEKNAEILNILPCYFSHIHTLSPRARNFILNFPLQKAVTILYSYHLDSAVGAFSCRVNALQAWVQDKMTIQEINDRFRYMDPTLDLQLPCQPESQQSMPENSQWQRV